MTLTPSHRLYAYAALAISTLAISHQTLAQVSTATNTNHAQTTTVSDAALNPTSIVTVISITGTPSVSLYGDSRNTVMQFDIGAFSHVVGVAWGVELQAYSPSWLSEMYFSVENSSQSNVVAFAPALGFDTGGIWLHDSPGFIDLIGQGTDFYLNADGIVRLEFFESTDDVFVNPDGRWNTGTLRLQTIAVPEPTTHGLMLIGALAVAAVVRRQRRKCA